MQAAAQMKPSATYFQRLQGLEETEVKLELVHVDVAAANPLAAAANLGTGPPR